MTPEQENLLYLSKCRKEKIKPSKEHFEMFQQMVMAREQVIQSEGYKAFEKERKRRQQRTVDQTIQEDGAIISPINEKAYVTKRSWEDHKKAENVIEVGNETANKRKREKTLS